MKDKDMQKLKELEMEILDHFADFCQRHKLKYFLTYGSLLGAVRHKGFIPWDDDLDVLMLPDDYQKFLELYPKEEHKRYILQNIDTEKYYHTIFTKIRMDNTCMVEKEWQYIKIHKGINIDVFPLFPYPDNKKDAKKLMFNLKLAQVLASKNNKTNKLVNKILFGTLRIIPRRITNKWISKIVKKALNYPKEYHYYRSDELHDPLMKKEWYAKSLTVPYEDRKYTIPKEYDKILTTMYGDYMTPPPVSERRGHGEIILSFNKNYEDL